VLATRSALEAAREEGTRHRRKEGKEGKEGKKGRRKYRLKTREPTKT
jgi:hypothetical protein